MVSSAYYFHMDIEGEMKYNREGEENSTCIMEVAKTKSDNVDYGIIG